MKVVLPTKTYEKKKPILSLVVDESELELTKSNSRQFELRINPNEEKPTYKQSCRILSGHETVRQVLQWYHGTCNAIKGNNLTSYADQKALCETLLKNTYYTAFRVELDKSAKKEWTEEQQTRYKQGQQDNTESNAETIAAVKKIKEDGIQDTHRKLEHIMRGLRAVLHVAIPANALKKVKRYFRRECRKPADMKVRDFFQCLAYINNEELDYFPSTRPTNRFTAEEVIDILLFATPRSWQRKMEEHGFDPMDATEQEVLDKMEQFEAAEEFDGDRTSKTVTSNKKSKPNSNKSSGGGKYCLIHGNGNHTSDECHTLKAKAEEAKKGFKSGNSGNKSSSWKDKAKFEKMKTNKELSAYIKKSISDGVKKELASIEKKRSAEELNAVEQEDEDLKAFDFGNLSIKDDVSC